MRPLRLLTPEDIVTLASLADARVSPDGRWVAYMVADSYRDRTRHPESRIWLVSTNSGHPRPLTGGPHADHAPRWSPDGELLLFLSNRESEERHLLYLISPAGGEATALPDPGGSPYHVEWSPCGDRIAFLMVDARSEEERRRREDMDDAIVVEEEPRYSRLHVIAPSGGRSHPVTGHYQVWDYGWSPDGTAVAAVISDDPYAWSWYAARLVRISLDDGVPETLCTSSRQFALPVWSPDGSRIAFLTSTWSDAGVIGGDLCVIPAAGGAVVTLTEGYAGSVTWMDWEGDGCALLCCAQDEGRITLLRICAETGRRDTLWSDEATFAERAWPRFSRAPRGQTIAVAREDSNTPRDIWVGHLEEAGVEWNRRTDHNPQIRELHLAHTRTLHWTAPDGTPIQGLLATPPDWQPGQRIPLVVHVHGGPANLWPHRFQVGPSVWSQLLAAQGVAVLMPNPRGSTGWGVPFTEANLGDMGGQDWHDILAGADHCVELGIADPDRLGLGGWSYGGFITAWGVTQTDRFRAAVMGAGICHWRSFHGVTDIPAWDALFYRASPYEQGGVYDRFSAIHFADRVRTPTLILHGEQDTCVPVGQAYEFFRALKEHQVPTQLVVYPREGHGIQERRHQEDVLRRVADWFTKYLKA